MGLLGHVTLLDWRPAREYLTLYVECALRPEEGFRYCLPRMRTLVAVLRVSDGTLRTEIASELSLSPSGGGGNRTCRSEHLASATSLGRAQVP